jgi:hypothetical protein
MLRSALVSAGIIVLFGVVLPLSKGVDYLDPLILAGCLGLSVVIVAPAAASTFSGAEPLDGRAALRRLGIVWLYAWAMGIAVLIAGLITVNVAARYRGALLPRASFIAAALAWSATATLFFGLVSAMVARRYSAGAARNAVRLVFLGLILFLFAMARFNGPQWLQTMHAWCTAPHLRKLFAFAAAGLALADGLLAAVLLRTPRYSVPQEEGTTT